ncbi:MAG TPA: ABC transporter permease [Dehalococcoidia bacterium]|nr:ABC transporter permease [Dehalococcoidia bacterium]
MVDAASGLAVELPVVARPQGRRPFLVDVFLRLFRHKPLGAVGFLLILLLLAVAAIANFAPRLIPYGYNDQNVSIRLQAPSRAHLAGTDKFGRDVFSRVLHGARVSVAVGFGATAIGVLFATLLGVLSGYLGGWFDTVLQRLVDVVMSVPTLVLLLILVTYARPGLVTVIWALGVSIAFRASRIIRGSVIALRGAPFIEATRVCGSGPLRVMLAHIVPNLFPLMIVIVTVDIGAAILAEAALSFLGLGIPPPLPSWGGMLSDRQYMLQAPWLSLAPGIALALTVYAWNMFGDAMRDLLDPYLHNTGSP